MPQKRWVHFTQRAGGSLSLRYFSGCNSSCKAEGETSEIWRKKILKQNLSVSPGFGSAQACSNKLALSLTRLLEEALAPILDYCCERQVWKEVCQTDGERKTPPKETHPEGQHLNSLLILLAHPPDIHLRALRYQILIFKSYQRFILFFPFNF